MKTPLCIVAVLILACFARADETVLTRFSWKEIADAGKLASGTVIETGADQGALQIENSGTQPLRANVLTVTDPKITTAFYAITGELRYEHVEGEGFLEMWNHFGEAAYFSRTLAKSGPLASLRGDSAWRAFSLPFDASATKSKPSQLVMNLQLPGEGVVVLRNVRLVESTSFGDLIKQPGAWWSDRAAGWVGGLGGAFLGCFASLVEWLASRGKGARLIVPAYRALIAVGVLASVAGLAAVTLRQPYGVWYPLLLCGVLCVAFIPFRLRRHQQRCRETELRRISSMDLTAH